MSKYFFFCPTPSWLSPGRSTSSYLPKMNCEKHAKPSHVKAAKESECGPLHSPSNCLIAAKQHTKTGNQLKQKHKPPKRTMSKYIKPWHPLLFCSGRKSTELLWSADIEHLHTGEPRELMRIRNAEAKRSRRSSSSPTLGPSLPFSAGTERSLQVTAAS